RGEVVEADTKLVAPEGRLVRRIDRWDDEAAREFGLACALRLRDRAIESVDAGWMRARARRRAASLRALASAGERLESKGRDDATRQAGAYVRDAAAVAGTSGAAGAAFVAARASGFIEGPEAVLAERRWQADWL